MKKIKLMIPVKRNLLLKSMLRKYAFHILFLFSFCLLSVGSVFSQSNKTWQGKQRWWGMDYLCRGAVEEELYISTLVGYNSDNHIFATFYSNDNGASFELKHSNSTGNSNTDLIDGNPIGTHVEGHLYNVRDKGLWCSQDYGATWNLVDSTHSGRYISGLNDAELYIYTADNKLLRTYNGIDYEELVTTNFNFLDAGYQDGEFYGLTNTTLLHTTDYGLTFEAYPLPEVDAFDKICRGYYSGEVYYMSYSYSELDYNLYFSNNNGATWELIYESEYLLGSYPVLVGGHVAGEVFVEYWEDGNDCNNTIDCITNYGEHHVHYVHRFCHEYDGVETNQKAESQLRHYPNPFSTQTTIVIPVAYQQSGAKLQVYNILGKLVAEQGVLGVSELLWKAQDASGNTLPSGMYLYRLVAEQGQQTTFSKMLLQ